MAVIVGPPSRLRAHEMAADSSHRDTMESDSRPGVPGGGEQTGSGQDSVSGISPDSTRWASQTWDPKALVQLAWKRNPGMRAQRLQVKGLHSNASHTWYLDAPQIGVDFFQAPVATFPNPLGRQSEIDYSVQQAFPFPGKIAARIDAVHQHAEMGEADLLALRRKVARLVRDDFYGLDLTRQRQAINAENRGLMIHFIAVARRQYEVGLGHQADILRAQAELTRLQSDSIDLVEARASTLADLNALLDFPTAREWNLATPPDPKPIDWTLEQLRPLIEKEQPGLKSMRIGVAMRQAELRAAGKEYLPDIMVEGMYKDMLRMPPGSMTTKLEDFWSVGVSVNLPFAFWSAPKYQAGISEGQANLESAEQAYSDSRNGMLAAAQAALQKSRRGAARLRLNAEALVPQSEQALVSMLAAYEGGKEEFTPLLEAYRGRWEARENLAAARANALSTLADLEDAVGMDLDEIARRLAPGAGK